MISVSSIAIWTVAIATLGCVLLRPRGLPEWVSASAGAALVTAFGLLTPHQTLEAIGRGTDVYAFLGGMMLLAEAARLTGLFDWIAAHAVRAAAGSRFRLFVLVYAACVAVTVVLSNDATAVVLTPAVAAAVRRAGVPARPYLFACAFVANAASFVLPISNPANLVIFGRDLPSLAAWLALFAAPSVAAIVITFVALGLLSRDTLRGKISGASEEGPLGPTGRIALGGIVVTVVTLLVASTRGASLGMTTAIAALGVLATLAIADRHLVRGIFGGVTWSVVPLVAGLFVLVAAVDRTGVLAIGHRTLQTLGTEPRASAIFRIGIATGLVSNLTNNLPSGLLAGLVLGGTGHARELASATAIGIDLGPNFSISGSLATVLWVGALAREGVAIGPLEFLRVGAVVMPPALAGALGAAAAFAR